MDFAQYYSTPHPYYNMFQMVPVAPNQLAESTSAAITSLAFSSSYGYPYKRKLRNPGPLPANEIVVEKDEDGVDWIQFLYSRERITKNYKIRCDISTVNVDELDTEFKKENCIYPKACVPPEQYKGNRQKYESECNIIGWSLAKINPIIAGKRGLIQRAVDSWRNTNADPGMRSRRIRKLKKSTEAKHMRQITQYAADQGGQLKLPDFPPPGHQVFGYVDMKENAKEEYMNDYVSMKYE